jgi:hypothetical protein
MKPKTDWVDCPKSYFYTAIFALTLLIQWLVTAGHLLSPDGELLFRTAESIALRGSLAVDPLEYDPVSQQLLVPPTQTFLTVQGRNGDFFAQYLPLQPLLATPLVWIAVLTEPVFAEVLHPHLPNTLGHPRLSPSESWRRFVVVTIFNPLVHALTVLLLLRLVGFLLEGMRRPMAACAFLFMATTMILPHSRTFFTESLAMLFFLIALDQIARWYRMGEEQKRARLKASTIVGVAFALGIWVRSDSPFIVLGMGLAFVGLGEWKRLRNSSYGAPTGKFPLLEYAIPGLMSLLSFGLLVAFNQWRFAENATLLGGGYGDNPEGIKFTTPLLIGLQGYLLSPGKSIFLFSPGIILALWGWYYAPPQAKWLRGFLFCAYIPFTLAMTLWQNWDGGWCWGPRHIVQLHAPLMIGAAFLFIRYRIGLLEKCTHYLIILAGVLAQFIGSLQSPLDFYREMYLTIDDGLYYSTSMRPMEIQTIAAQYRVMEIHPTNRNLDRPVSPLVLPAPLTDSLYVPQHTQWTGASLLWQAGYCDILFLRVLGFGTFDLDKPRDTAEEFVP